MGALELAGQGAALSALRRVGALARAALRCLARFSGRYAKPHAASASLPSLLLALLLAALAAPAAATDRGALFKVSGEGHILYLFGTMHVGQADFYPFEARLAAAVAAAPTLALELDPTLPPALAARALQRHGMTAADVEVPAALAPRLDAALRRAGIAPQAVAHYKPWLIAAMLAVAEYSRLGYDSALAVDSHLAALAQAHHVKLLELEGIDAQLALLDSMAPADQWAFLEQTVSDIASGKQRDEAGQIARAWASADRAALDAIAARLAADSSVAGRFMREVLLDGRNGALAAGIADLLRRQDHGVAAIGVLHLLGPGSVPALLRARGLGVERMY